MNIHHLVKRITLASVLLALGILLPLCFHGIPNAGSIFLPMHIPVLLAGFLLGPLYGLLLGILTPLFSFTITGMPNAVMLPEMLVELLFYGFLSGAFFRLIKTHHLTLDIIISLTLALLIGKAMRGITAIFLYMSRGNAYTWQIFFTALFVTAWPGLLIQYILIPTLLLTLAKIGFIKEKDRYLFPNYRLKKREEETALFFTKTHKETIGNLDKFIALYPQNLLDNQMRVLDVGAGTGVIEPYLAKKFSEVVALDLSKESLEIAQKNIQEANVDYVNLDYFLYRDKQLFDMIILYNTYPHFLDLEKFEEKTLELLKEGGYLLVIQDENRLKINQRAKKKKISRPLLPIEEELKNYKKRFAILLQEDNDKSYRFLLKKLSEEQKKN